MEVRNFKFSNGDQVKEVITGFTGTITGTSFYLTGCNQHLVVPKCTDTNQSPDGSWYDEGRLELIKPAAFKQDDVASDKNGCDIPPTRGKRGH